MCAAQPGSVKYLAAFLEMCRLYGIWLLDDWAPCGALAALRGQPFELAANIIWRKLIADWQKDWHHHTSKLCSLFLCSCYRTTFFGQKSSVTYVFKIYPLGFLQNLSVCVFYVHLFWCSSVDSWRYLRRFLMHVLFSQFWNGLWVKQFSSSALVSHINGLHMFSKSGHQIQNAIFNLPSLK